MTSFIMKFIPKNFFPVRSYLVSDNVKYPLQGMIENALARSRQILRIFFRKEKNSSINQYRHQYRLPLDFPIQNSGQIVPKRLNLISFRPGFIQKVTSRWAADSLVSKLGRETARKIIHGSRKPMLCFLGFGLAKKPSILTDEQELEGVSFQIRDAFSRIPWQKFENDQDEVIEADKSLKLSNLNFGHLIAKGCNAAVYSAAWKQEQDIDQQILKDPCNTAGKSISKSSEKLIMPHSEGEEIDNDLKKEDLPYPTGNLAPFHLAVKVMFNYSAESNAYAIWRAMYKETLPTSGEFPFAVSNWNIRKRRLPPHPNIVKMYGAFADQTPLLPGAFQNYPQALPHRLSDDGCGRNMTLFLVMKQYHCSLKDYLNTQEPSSRTCLLLLTQLFEALVHLLQYNVVHRDLKTDNILLDLKYGIIYPRLAITDFGCCHENMKLFYPSDNIDKGGNMALMAPEVIDVEPGPFAFIDYSRSDLWTAGTLAYEIYGVDNPFLSKNSEFKAKCYKIEDLPLLPAKAPPIVQKLVKDILQRDPNMRPSQNFVATVCQLLLHAPGSLLNNMYEKKTHKKVLDWLFLISSETYLQATLQPSKTNSIEFELRHTFCSRLQFSEVLEALHYMVNT